LLRDEVDRFGGGYLRIGGTAAAGSGKRTSGTGGKCVGGSVAADARNSRRTRGGAMRADGRKAPTRRDGATLPGVAPVRVGAGTRAALRYANIIITRTPPAAVGRLRHP